MGKLSKEEAIEVYKEGIDQAVRERNIELLVGLLSKPHLPQEIRDYLANVVEDLLSNKKSFPNRKPKQDLEEKRRALAARVREVEKEKGWKRRSVVDFVTKEMRCSKSTVWGAWREYGPVLIATEIFRERYDLDAVLDAMFDRLSKSGRVEFGRATEEEIKIFRTFSEEIETQRGLRRTGRSKLVRT